MAKLNSIRVVLAERDLNNKWLSDRNNKRMAGKLTTPWRNQVPSLHALCS